MGVNNKDGRKPTEERIPGEAKEMLKSLASKWEDVIDANALKVIPLKGAMTNEVFQIKWPTKTTSELSRKVVVRIYGAGVEVFFDRDDEIRTFEFMSKQGQGPRLLGRFPNGRIEEFIRARTLSAPDLHDPEISVLIAAKMREFHCLDISGQKVTYLWDKLSNWLKVAKDMCSPDEAKAFRLNELDEEITLLQNKLSVDQRIGFCHNDLQYGNIMIDEETRAITIIDYEYSSYNPVAFDIANHFCEMTADYHTDTPHVVDYSKYPGPAMRKQFVVAYLSSSVERPSDKEVEQLLEDVENYTLGSHLFWGLWGIISEHVNKIDFDYLEYSRQRFEQYWLKRSILFTSTEAVTPATAIAMATTTIATATPTTTLPAVAAAVTTPTETAALTTPTTTLPAVAAAATTPTETAAVTAPTETAAATAPTETAAATAPTETAAATAPTETAAATAPTETAAATAPTETAAATAPTETANTNMTKTTTTAKAEELQGKESGSEDKRKEVAAGGESSMGMEPTPGKEAGKGASSEQTSRSKHGQAGVFRKFKRYLGFSNVFKKNSHSHPKSADLHPKDDAAAKTPRD